MVSVQQPVFTSGNLANWWEEETKNRFLEKANCIIWQYGNYSADSINKTLNGVNTQVSIIASMVLYQRTAYDCKGTQTWDLTYVFFLYDPVHHSCLTGAKQDVTLRTKKQDFEKYFYIIFFSLEFAEISKFCHFV